MIPAKRSEEQHEQEDFGRGCFQTSWIELFKTSAGAVTADVVDTARGQESDMEPEEETELLQPHDKATDEALLLTGEQRKCILRWALLPGEVLGIC